MKILERASKIAEGFNSSIYQLSDDTYGREVILKVMKEDFNYHPHSSQLYNEDKYLRGVSTRGVRGSIDLIEDSQSPILVLEYFEGISLKSWVNEKPRTFIDCLKVAIQICEALHEVHSKYNLIHRDISAHNILINDQMMTNIIDFGLAINVDTKLNIKGMSDQLLGTLPYISPEQTGRVNHAVDYRSDLYSLGVVLYELFTGQLPFNAADPLELIHAHLAITPQPLSSINHEIPTVFSDIILKLLSKDVEKRYQSARGLLEDLKKCMNQAALRVEIQHFELAQNDESGRFLIPSKIYGREEQISQLLSAVENIGSGQKEVTLVSGKSGTGKTSLLYEIHKPITGKKGYFIKGKHQQFQKDRPYQAISQAISSFISLILSENEQRLAHWRGRLQEALKDQGKLITDFIPNLELIVGKQDNLPILGINEAQNRFNYVFTQFIKVLATKEHPLVLFIDDLQWADNASLKLIRNLIIDNELTHFYFIGAYRDNEIDSKHPFNVVFSELPKQGVAIQQIHLEDLSFTDTQSMIMDTFSCNERKARELTHVVQTKTAGNPFFVNQFLKSIYEKGLITYQHGATAGTGSWEWDIEQLESTNYTENVVDFMVDKLRKMNPGTQQQLTLGACIGDRFHLKTLSYIQAPGTRDLMSDLWQAVIEQLLFVEESHGDVAHIAQLKNPEADTMLTYRFAHDRIRQAAYELIPDKEKAKVHQRIGELLLHNIDLEKQSDQVFEVVNQLNRGVGRADDGYRIRLCELNYMAGSKAKASSAYESAIDYFEAALRTLEDSDWMTNHSLLQALHLTTMEAYYILGKYDQMKSIGDLLLRKATSKMEYLQPHNVFIQSYIARSKHLDLITYGLSILKEVGIKLPSRPSDTDILVGLVQTKLKLIGKKAGYFEALPDMEDEHMALAINMMTSISTASYHNFPKLFPIVILKSIRLSIRYGHSIDSIPFYGGYGTILCGVLGDYSTGYEFGQLSLRLLQKSSRYKAVVPKTLVIFYGFINHWKDALRASLDPYEEAYLAAMEIGDNQYAASAAFLKACTGFLSGLRLDELVPEIEHSLERMPSLKQESYHQYMKIVYQGIHNLSSGSELPWELEGSVFSQRAFESDDYKKELREDDTALFHISFYQLYLNFLFGRYEEAFQGMISTKKYLEVVLSTAYIPLVNFYDSLVRLKLYATTSSSQRKKHLRQVKANQKKMKRWSEHSPTNYLHKYLLVEAETLSVIRADQSVKGAYDQCIKAAEANEYLNELALCYELAGRHHGQSGDEELQSYYMAKALKTYRKWGARAKANQLKDEFPYLEERKDRSIHTSFSGGSFSYGSLSGNNLLDLASVLKAATTISSEIKLSRAIPTLLDILTENAGAQSGAFVFLNNDVLELYARSSVNEEAKMVPAREISEVSDLPVSVIQYVRRTQDTVLLDHAEKDERFHQDQYLQTHSIASILCMPVIHQQALLGIIYLENRLTKGSFTAERTDLLSLLSGQIAITLHNALLYDQLEQRVEERTREIEKQKNKLNHQNLQLTELNEEKDFLISVVSHDLRNPLHLIKGYTNLALKNKDPKEAEEFLGYVIESSNRMEGFISRILNVSAINSREINLNYSEVEMVNLLNDEVKAFEAMAKEKDINYSFQSDEAQLPTSIDPGYFNQIISNLISNAIKYTQPGGQIQVRLELIAGGDYYRISVEDNGQGISTRDQKLLFSKFQTLSAKPTGGEESTGLGLAIVKKYVEAMDGRIWCKSEYEEGSQFFVEFPIDRN